MESVKLYDSEWKLMEILWEGDPVSARDLAVLAAERIGWNKNTTYTIIKKLVEKGVIRREEPGFSCTSLVKKEEVQRSETRSLIDKLFRGSRKAFFAALLEDEEISEDELAQLKDMIEKR